MKYNDNVYIFGSFGFGNLGDELVPDCFRTLLREAGLERNVGVLSRFEGTKIGETNPFPDLDDTHGEPQSGTVILVGGGIVEPRDYSCMNRAFSLQSKRPSLKIAAHAVSVEPGVEFSWARRRQLKRQLSQIEFPTVRDVLSAETLMRLSPSTSIRVVGDIGLWIEPDELPESLTKCLQDHRIAVIIGDSWDTPDFIDWITNELILIARQMDSGIILLPFSGAFGRDFAINEQIKTNVTRFYPNVQIASVLDHLEFVDLTPRRAAAVLQSADLCISTRLHGCVVSYAMGTPFIALAYHPKLRGFVETVGQRSSLFPDNLPISQSINTYGYKFSDLNIQPGSLAKRVETVIERSDFSAVPYFRNLQIEAIRELFG